MGCKKLAAKSRRSLTSFKSRTRDGRLRLALPLCALNLDSVNVLFSSALFHRPPTRFTMSDPPQAQSSFQDPLQDMVETTEKLTIQVETTHQIPVQDVAPHTPRPLVVYTRTQLLALSQSSLVKPLDNMPQLREWFGCVTVMTVLSPISQSRPFLSDWTEQTGKGYSETATTSSTARDRRCVLPSDLYVFY